MLYLYKTFNESLDLYKILQNNTTAYHFIPKGNRSVAFFQIECTATTGDMPYNIVYKVKEPP